MLLDIQNELTEIPVLDFCDLPILIVATYELERFTTKSKLAPPRINP